MWGISENVFEKKREEFWGSFLIFPVIVLEGSAFETQVSRKKVRDFHVPFSIEKPEDLRTGEVEEEILEFEYLYFTWRA